MYIDYIHFMLNNLKQYISIIFAVPNLTPAINIFSKDRIFLFLGYNFDIKFVGILGYNFRIYLLVGYKIPAGKNIASLY